MHNTAGGGGRSVTLTAKGALLAASCVQRHVLNGGGGSTINSVPSRLSWLEGVPSASSTADAAVAAAVTAATSYPGCEPRRHPPCSCCLEV